MSETCVITGGGHAARATAEAMTRAGANVALFPDVSNEQDARRMAEELEASHDRIDLLVNYVSAPAPHPELVTTLLSRLLQRGRGAVINVTAVDQPNPCSFYDPAPVRKSDTEREYRGARGLNRSSTRALREKLGEDGLAICALHPGAFNRNVAASLVAFWLLLRIG